MQELKTMVEMVIGDAGRGRETEQRESSFRKAPSATYKNSGGEKTNAPKD